MNAEKLISVIVPVYMVQDYLSECLESIINQTYRNLEIILVDDGSPDDCGKICDDYAKKDSRIKVIHKANGGVSDARNVGIANANGFYIGFVDSDDYLDNRFFEILISLIVEYDSDIAECYSYSFQKGTRPCIKNTNKVKCINSKQWITETNLGNFLSCVVWNKLYKKDLFDGISFPIGMRFEDEATIYKIIFKAKKIVRIDSVLYFYRQWENSFTSQELDIKGFEQKCSVLYEKCLFFHEKHEIDLELFSYSKLFITLLSNFNILSKESSENKEKWLNIMKEKKSLVYRSKAVPLKYKIYIALKSINLEKVRHDKE